ncbi:MAG TPA: saccharopine dehydrogenase C-terminal domain-containing protein, partial [Chryseosolibacter sp.]|nr:saccharopine dehydrogenase C-terminal domain-containing protein [Chryseosolibacter sp.]
MKTILVLGAGRSSSSLITYLLDQAKIFGWNILVGDASPTIAKEKIQNHPNGHAIAFNIEDESASGVIQSADCVISLLPAMLHPIVAINCLKYNKHLLTASYVSDEMKALDAEARHKGLIFLNECGLDPGIDHMTAMQVIDKIRSEDGKITGFESFTGGLIARDTDPENPWRYKFTWNPRNVVMAGQGTAKFLLNGKYKYIPYQQLFKRTTPVHVPGYGDYEGYANRDSLKYIDTYKLHGVRTMLRGTLRNRGYCSAWNVFVQLGCCDDSYQMDGVSAMTHADFINSFLPADDSIAVKTKLQQHPLMNLTGNELDLLEWSGMFADERVGLNAGTPAQILEHILNKKWKLSPNDKDQIVMWHRFAYEQDGKEKELQAWLVATGTDSIYTAMAKTVGLPLAIAAKLVMQEKIKARGVLVPISKEIYEPILSELAQFGI